MRMPRWIRRHLAAIRALLVLTAVTGIIYPLAATGVAQAIFNDQANGSPAHSTDGRHVGSRIIGQSFNDADGDPIKTYFQTRPSAAGDDGYDPTATGGSQLGPEDIVDSPDGPSLLTQVCARSKAVGELEGVDGRRAYCTDDGVGAVLAVYGDHAVSANQRTDPFIGTYRGLPVRPAEPGKGYDDYAAAGARIVPVRGDAPAVPAVPPDAVAAGASGLDPQISPEYAALQVPRVAKERGMSEDELRKLVERHTTGRALGFMGEPAVNIIELNLALDERP